MASVSLTTVSDHADNDQTAKARKNPVRRDKASEPMAPLPPIAGRIAAAWLFGLAILLLCVSLPHLAAGVSRITQTTTVAAWFMAVCFDLSQIVCEVAVLLAPLLHLKTRVHRPCYGVIITCTLMSMVLNVDAFLQHADDLKGWILATTWGILLPLGVLTLSYIASIFVLDRARS